MRKSTFKIGFLDTCHIWENEFRYVFKDIGVLLFFFALPFAYPILYALIYNPEVVRDVPMVVVDHSRTPLSRELVQKMDATPNAEVVSYCANMEEAKRMMHEKKAYGILLIPENFSRSLLRGGQSVISFYADMSLLLNYKGFLMALTEVSMNMGAELQAMALQGATQQQISMATTPVPFRSVALYNPESGFASFVIPAILILILQQSLILGIGMLAGGIYENKQLHLYYDSERLMANNVSHLVFGKALCYFCLYIIPTVYILHVVPYLFKFPQLGSQWEIYIFSVPFLLSSIFFGMTLSVFVRERETSFLLFVFTSIVFLFVSGITWPTYAMPSFWKYFSYLIPATWGIEGFVKMNTSGSSLSDVGDSYFCLWILTGVYFVTSCLIYRYQIYKDKRRGFQGKMSSLSR